MNKQKKSLEYAISSMILEAIIIYLEKRSKEPWGMTLPLEYKLFFYKIWQHTTGYQGKNIFLYAC